MQINEYELNDILECARYRTKHFWLSRIKSAYSDVTTDDPIIDQFKFFTVWPANVYFYVDGDEIKRESTVVRSKIFDDTFTVNPDRMILLSVYNRNNERVIRYAETVQDILA